ncbi:hypothetical protein INR49_014872, partial [Caranx melampygus]
MHICSPSPPATHLKRRHARIGHRHAHSDMFAQHMKPGSMFADCQAKQDSVAFHNPPEQEQTERLWCLPSDVAAEVGYDTFGCTLESEQNKSNLKVTSPEDAEHVSRRQASPNGTPPSRGDPKGSRTVPRRHTLGGARSSREILAMQPSDMDKKREAFLEHLKQKYPHHASAIMGHQERLREQ